MHFFKSVFHVSMLEKQAAAVRVSYGHYVLQILHWGDFNDRKGVLLFMSAAIFTHWNKNVGVK
jgi:hypothetical protein